METDNKISELKVQLETADREFSDRLNTFKNVVNKNKTKIYKEIYHSKNLTLSLKTSIDDFFKNLVAENSKHLSTVEDRIDYMGNRMKVMHDEIYGKKETVVKKKVKVRTEGQKTKIKKIEEQIKHLKAETRKSFCKLDQSLRERPKSVDYTYH